MKFPAAFCFIIIAKYIRKLQHTGRDRRGTGEGQGRDRGGTGEGQGRARGGTRGTGDKPFNPEFEEEGEAADENIEASDFAAGAAGEGACGGGGLLAGAGAERPP